MADLFPSQQAADRPRSKAAPPLGTPCSQGAGARRKRRDAIGQKTFYPTELDPDVAVIAAAVEQEFRDPIVPEHQREQLRRLLGMRPFYEDWMLPARRRAVTAGELAAKTLSKDRQVLTRWEHYSRPDTWPTGKPWFGVPIGSITGLYIRHVLDRMRADLSISTVRSTWNHLQSILNYAETVRALEKAPRPTLEKLPQREAKTYTREQIETAYNALADYVDLQVAFVLAINAGPRPVDLFLLRWDRVDLVSDRPTLSFIARKTGKEQRVPLAPVTVQQLLRLPSRGCNSFLFPGRSSWRAKEPEDSEPARRRRDLVRILLTHAGLQFAKPFQVARATCNTHLNSTPGFNNSGKFVLGHDLSLNSVSYMNPSDLIFQAINACWQPPCFSLVC